MKNTKRFIHRHGSSLRCVALALGIFALLACCACGAQGEADPSPTPQVLLETTPSPVPVQGGTLLLPISVNPFTQDEGIPAALGALSVKTEEMRNFYSLIYEPLMRCDNQNRIVPSLAERWSVDETGLVWTIELRKSVWWHTADSMLDASDVIYTMEQIRTLGNNSYYFAALDAAVASFERVNDTTLRVTMKKRGMQSLYALLFPVLSADGGSVGGLPIVGTGPYRIERYVESASDAYVNLEINPQWWKQSPYFAGVRCFARVSASVALDSYEAGLLNMVLTDSTSSGKYREEGVTNVMDVMTQDAELLLVNHSRPVLAALQMRQAIAYALDRGAIISNVYMNHATVADVPVPPDSFLYSPASKVYDYNADAARELLAQMGWADNNIDGILERNGRNLTLRLLVNESTENGYRKSAAAMVEAQLEAVGFAVEIETAKYRLGESESEFQARLSAGDYDIAMVGFSLPRSGDLAPYLAAGGAHNYAGYSSAALMELVNRAGAAIDETAMRETHALLQTAFVEELPFIMLYFRMNSLVYSAGIQGVADVRDTDILRTVEKWYVTVR